MSRERHGWLLVAAILLPLLWVKFSTNALMVDLGVDGSYYMDVADHVRQGLGLRTEVSLYHQGMIGFPYPTPVYPLWPLLLGWVARFSSLDGAAVWLPTALYFLSLLLGYVWAKGLSDRPIFPGIWELPHAGHLVVVALGLNDLYYEHSSKPYTEPMAFVVLFAALIRFRDYFQRPSLLRGVEAGVWLAVLLLIRSQMIVTAAGFFGAAGLRLLFPAPQEPRSRAALGLGGSLLGYGLGLLPQILFLRSFIPHAGFRDLLRFDAWQANPRLPVLNLLVPTDGIWGWIVDRSQGFLLAFSENSSFSYQISCSYYFLALPILVLVLIGDSLRTGLMAPLRALWDGLRREGFSYGWFFVLFSVGWWLSLHVLHKAYFTEWNFGMRHALPCLFLFGFCTWKLLTRGDAWRLAGLFLLMTSIRQGLNELPDTKEEQARDDRLWARAKRLAAALPPEEIICTSMPTRMGRARTGGGVHGIYPNATRLEDLKVLFAAPDQGGLGCTLLALTGADTLPFQKEADFLAAFAPTTETVEGWKLYRRLEETP